MQDFPKSNELFYIYPSDFKANHPTDTYLSQWTDMILKSAETGKYTSMILINLLKGFDTWDHKILLDKVKCKGFSNKMVLLLSQTELFLFH